MVNIKKLLCLIWKPTYCLQCSQLLNEISLPLTINSELQWIYIVTIKLSYINKCFHFHKIENSKLDVKFTGNITRQHGYNNTTLNNKSMCNATRLVLVLFVPRVVRGFAVVKLACKYSALDHRQSCALCYINQVHKLMCSSVSSDSTRMCNFTSIHNPFLPLKHHTHTTPWLVSLTAIFLIPTQYHISRLLYHLIANYLNVTGRFVCRDHLESYGSADIRSW